MAEWHLLDAGHGLAYRVESELLRPHLLELEPLELAYVVLGMHGLPRICIAQEEAVDCRHREAGVDISVGQTQKPAPRRDREASLLAQFAYDGLLEGLARIYKSARQIEGALCRLAGAAGCQQVAVGGDDHGGYGGCGVEVVFKSALLASLALEVVGDKLRAAASGAVAEDGQGGSRGGMVHGVAIEVKCKLTQF